MQFLDNILLGANTPRHADLASYPSGTFRKSACTRKHCSTMCTTKLFEEFEFWAHVLSEEQVQRDEVRRNIHTMKRDLRFSVWVRISGCRDGAGMEAVGPSKSVDDRDLVAFILDACKETGSQEAVFNIFRNLEKMFPGTSESRCLVLFIRHILDLPHAGPEQAFRLMCMLMRQHNLGGVFAEKGDAAEFWMRVVENGCVLEQIIDLVLCHEGADLCAVPRFVQKQTGDDVQGWMEFLDVRSNVERLDAVFRSTRVESAVEECGCEETYFDFVVVQNELIRAQEAMRAELGARISELETERDELDLQKQNLVGACRSLEDELRECQEGYVNEVKRMFYDAKSQCERYEKENMELRLKLYGRDK